MSGITKSVMNKPNVLDELRCRKASLPVEAFHNDLFYLKDDSYGTP